MKNILSKILFGIKTTFQKHNKLISILLSILAIFVVAYPGRFNCKYAEGGENCSFDSEGIALQVIITLFVIGVVYATIFFRAKLLSRAKYFWAKSPIIMIVAILLFMGLFPFPIRCSSNMITRLLPPGFVVTVQIIPTKGFTSCYYPFEDKFWNEKKLEWRFIPTFFHLFSRFPYVLRVTY